MFTFSKAEYFFCKLRKMTNTSCFTITVLGTFIARIDLSLENHSTVFAAVLMSHLLSSNWVDDANLQDKNIFKRTSEILHNMELILAANYYDCFNFFNDIDQCFLLAQNICSDANLHHTPRKCKVKEECTVLRLLNFYQFPLCILFN